MLDAGFSASPIPACGLGCGLRLETRPGSSTSPAEACGGVAAAIAGLTTVPVFAQVPALLVGIGILPGGAFAGFWKRSMG
jgi:hypothetical protein